MTSLHLASKNGHLCVVEFLLHNKADINAKGRELESGTPLHYASRNGHLRVVECLLNQKADINAKNWRVKFNITMKHLFILLLGMVILMLLNI